MYKKSVVIVGAGVAGMATAIILAKEGFEVTVYEKNSQSGGRCSQIVRNSHRFDLGATILLMPSIYREVFRTLDLDFDECFDLKDLTVIYKLYFGNGEQMVISRDEAVMKMQLEAFEPQSFNRYKAYLDAGYGFFLDSYKNLLARNFYTFFQFVNLPNLRMLFRLKVYLKHQTFIRKFFKNKNLQQAFTFQNIYVGQNPLEAPALFSMLSATEMVEGAFFPVGGMSRIPSKLESAAKEAGVKFVYNKVVTKIDINRKRASRLICDDGTITEFDLFVVNSDLPYAYRNLLPDKRLSSRLEHQAYACSALVFHWGLSKPFPAFEHHNIFLSKQYKESLDAIFNHHSLSANPSFYVHAPVRTDPSAAPENEDSISIIIPIGHLNEKNPQDWDALKKAARLEVLDRLKIEGFNDLEENIKFEVCYTPLAWKSIYNVSRGSVFGSIGHQIMQMGYFRPHNRHDCYKNLYFVGGSTHPGNGVPLAAHFWDADRFLAAKTCYRFMREIDDLIDNHKSENKEIEPLQRASFEKKVIHWIDSAHEVNRNDSNDNNLISYIKRYKIPRWTMDAFARSMIYDIYHDGFASLEIFLDYCSGASIAPASVFVHLCGIRPDDIKFREPDFDVRKAAEPCAVFSYIVHIIRDFQKDQHNNLNYFADDLIAEHGLDRLQLKQISEGGKIPSGFREMIRKYYFLADEYRLATYRMIQEIKPKVEPRYQLSLEIIFDLYLMVFERINPDSGLFTTAELNPAPCEIHDRVYQTILAFQELRQSETVNN